MKANDETATSGLRSFRSKENGDVTKVPTLSVTYNTRPSVPSSLEVTPSASDGAGLVTAAAQPTFAAVVTDPAAVRPWAVSEACPPAGGVRPRAVPPAQPFRGRPSEPRAPNP